MEHSTTLPVDGLNLGIEDLESLDSPSWLGAFLTGVGVGVAIGGAVFLT
jgi:hypothetical protein